MQGLKVIMCDCDGVLNSIQSIKRRLKLVKQKLLDPNEEDWPTRPMVDNLNYIIKETNAKLVISSSWKLFHPLYENDTLKNGRFRYSMKYIFERQSIIGEIIGKTPLSKLSGYRGLDIKEYLEENPNIDKYVILDDDSDMLEEQLPYFVQTNAKVGLTKEDAIKAIKILNG